jgi:dephospho-CoA kinase
MRRRIPIIGLAGGIGSGKSFVANELRKLGCAVVASDRLNHEILNRPAVLEQLRKWWGPSVINPDGTANRKAIGAVVFNDPEKKRRLESLTYPLIAQERARIILASESDLAVKAIILDSPLLFESRLDRLCDAILFIEADETERLARLKQTRGWDETEVRRRERWQLPTAEKQARSQYVIPNDGTVELLRRRAAKVLDDILKNFSSTQ